MSLHSPIEARRRANSATAAPRTTKRTRVLMTGVVLTPAGARKVRVRDISRTGVQVIGARDFPVDCDAIFRRGSLFAAARIAWVRGDEAGLEFYRGLSPEEVDGSVPPAFLRGPR
jgi:hypothetical protein